MDVTFDLEGERCGDRHASSRLRRAWPSPAPRRRGRRPRLRPATTIVNGPVLTVPSSAFTSGSDALCPTGTVVWGGGVAWHGFARPGENINTTDPAGSAGWNSLVDNTTGFSNAFNVDAICARKPTGYKRVTRSKPNASGASTTASVTCPVNTVVLSAGVLSESDSSAVEVISLWPDSKTKVTALMANGSGSDTTMEVEAVCGREPARYKIVRQPDSLTAGTDTIGSAECPGGTSDLGNGIKVPEASENFVISGLTDDGAGGVYYSVENNGATTADYTIFAICAA